MKYKPIRVLVCGPQSDLKRYCFDNWAKNVKNFTYPHFDVFLVDNSLTKKFSEEINDKWFECINITNDKNKDSVLSRLAHSHEVCRRVAIKRGYDYMLHLETDVFPPSDVIEKLLFEIHSDDEKFCIGAMYQHLENEHRTPILNTISSDLDDHRVVIVGGYNNSMIDGKVKNVLSAGLGCVLIKRELFKRLPFRLVKGAGFYPDVVWVNDLYRRGIKNWAHTDIICGHQNKFWGEYGVHYK